MLRYAVCGGDDWVREGAPFVCVGPFTDSVLLPPKGLGNPLTMVSLLSLPPPHQVAALANASALERDRQEALLQQRLAARRDARLLELRRKQQREREAAEAAAPASSDPVEAAAAETTLRALALRHDAEMVCWLQCAVDLILQVLLGSCLPCFTTWTYLACMHALDGFVHV